MKAKNNYTYEVAFKELQEIVQKIELGDVDIDQLSEYIKRAATLVKICEAKLTETEEEVQNLLKKLNEEDESNSETLEEDKVEEEQAEDYESIEEEDAEEEVENETEVDDMEDFTEEE